MLGVCPNAPMVDLRMGAFTIRLEVCINKGASYTSADPTDIMNYMLKLFHQGLHLVAQILHNFCQQSHPSVAESQNVICHQGAR
jgi:hypothetical protein